MGREKNNDFNLMFLIVLHLEEVNSYLKMSVFNVLFLRRCQHSGANLNGGGGKSDVGECFVQMGPDPYTWNPHIYIYIYRETHLYVERIDF